MKPKTCNLEDRPHLVVPVVMGVVGVWNGSHGPLFYPAEELRKSAQHWNGRPVVIYHPDMQTNCLAGAPSVFTKQRVGTLFNARFDPKANALKAEAWLDPARMEAVDARVLCAVKAGQMMEVSTGLFTDIDFTPGVHNGAPYDAIAHNYRPDHLAILPDQAGACSIAMGAGLCRNQRNEEEALPVPVWA